jgi:hypothetical protein
VVGGGGQWGSAAAREHEEGEGGRNLGKKGSEEGAHRKGEDGGTPTRFHRREGSSDARGRCWASLVKEGGGVLRRGRESTEGGRASMVLRPFYRRWPCGDGGNGGWRGAPRGGMRQGRGLGSDRRAAS